MCIETGVGSGSIWTYGKDIFATEEAAQQGVIKFQQDAYKERDKRDAYAKEKADKKRIEELEMLERLKNKYAAEVVE
jgi:hypothetical protein